MKKAALLPGLSLRANFSWTFAGNVLYAASQWGILVILAKLGSKEMVGQFSIGLAITAPWIEFANLRLRLIQATDAKQEYAFRDYLGLEIVTTCAALIAILVLAFTGDRRLETMLVVALIALAKGVENIADIFFGFLQRNDRMDYIARSMTLKGFLSLAALGGVVALTGSLVWGAVALFAAWLSVLLGYDLRNSLRLRRSQQRSGMTDPLSEPTFFRPRFNPKTLTRLAWLALPLGIATMLVALNANIPRYFVESNLGEGQLGVFAALAYFHRAGVTVVNALGESASPRLSRYLSAGQIVPYRALLLRMVGVGVLLGMGGVLVAYFAGELLLTLFYQADYARRDVFTQLMAASALAYVGSFLFYGLTAARKLRVQTGMYALATLVLVPACAILIPKYGLLGAATALTISRTVQLAGAIVTIWFAVPALRRKSIDKLQDIQG